MKLTELHPAPARTTHSGTRLLAAGLLCLGLAAPLRLAALEKPNVTYKVFQFPQDKIPRIDGEMSDWDIVPDDYVIGIDQFVNEARSPEANKPGTLNVKVKVGWVKGLNRLYFHYEAQDDFWDFSGPGLRNDTFEIVIDGDASGGPLIDKAHKDVWSAAKVGEVAAMPEDRISADETHWANHGVQAQNYHIFTPAASKDWCMAWSSATWIKEFPWSQAAYKYNFKHGESGKLEMEFYVTVFDYAGAEGPQRAVESVFRENKIMGVDLIVIDYDADQRNRGFWNMSPHHTAFGHASELCAFKLMPIEPKLLPALEARWSFSVVDMDRRLVAFKDESIGKVKSWKWDFGDGESSTEQSPLHAFKKPGSYVTILDITAEDGTTSRRSKVWDVQLR